MNAKTGKLEEMANSKQTIASDGTVMIDGYSGIDYIVSAKKLTGTSVVTMEQGVRFQIKKRLICCFILLILNTHNNADCLNAAVNLRKLFCWNGNSIIQ